MITIEATLFVLIGLPLFIFWITLLSNLFFMLRLGRTKQTAATPQPLVSILIPARNEERVVDSLLTHLCKQTYDNYEIILLDDNSTDNTREIAKKHPVSVIDGAPLPAGWLGKNWACHQLSQVANGDMLIFTDADVTWQPTAVTAIVNQLQSEKADLLAVFPTQKTETWSERLIVSLIDFVLLAYLPIWGVHHLPFTMLSAANGQCLAFRRSAYDHFGGHTAVQNEIVEDIQLGRVVKRHKQRLRITMANRLIHCRMYHNWPELLAGFSKNIVAAYGSIPALIIGVLYHWLLFIVPIIWLMIAIAFGSTIWPPATLFLAGIILRAIAAILSHQRPLDALLMPLSVLLISRIALSGIIQSWRGNLTWKGRQL